jgi:N-acetylmuramoyl-L-alanine amidase
MNRKTAGKGIRRAVTILAVLCFFSVPAAILALFQFYAQPAVPAIIQFVETDEGEDGYAEDVITITIPAPPETPLTEYAHKDNLIPIHIGMGIFYDRETRRVLMPPGEYAVEGGYFYNWHRVHIGGGVSGYKRIPVNDGLIELILWRGDDLLIYGDGGYFAEYRRTETQTYIQLSCPKDRYAAVVVIDPGHGGEDAGAPGRRLYEKDANLAITLALCAVFDREDIYLLPTRTEDVFITKSDRYRLANAMGDYFISIHNNADDRSDRTRGTETFYNASVTFCGFSGEDMARIVQAEMIKRLQSRDRGIAETHEFSVLINTRVPAVMAEVLFISNPEEEERLADPNTVLEIAMALRDAIEQLPLRDK